MDSCLGASYCRRLRSATQELDPTPLVLTDIDMPCMDGYALGRRLAVMRPGLPVIYMSGTTNGLAARVPLETWDYFIAKPFSADELLPKLHFALRRAAHGADTS
jgi:two-component system cell cycle sensor histidine kinase/response regulator CckA